MRILIFERKSLDTPHRTLQTGLGTITKSLYKDKKKTDDRGKLFERICGGRDGWGKRVGVGGAATGKEQFLSQISTARSQTESCLEYQNVSLLPFPVPGLTIQEQPSLGLQTQ